MPASKPLGQRIREAADNVREKTRWKNAAKRRKDNADSPEEYKRRLSVLEKLRKALAQAIERLKNLRAARKPKPDFNGHPSDVTPEIREVIVEAKRFGLYVTATTDGVHTPGSYHYQHRAVDLAAPMTADGIARMRRFHTYAMNKWPNALEVFGPGSSYIKNGRRYPGQFPNHGNHNHVAR